MVFVITMKKKNEKVGIKSSSSFCLLQKAINLAHEVEHTVKYP